MRIPYPILKFNKMPGKHLDNDEFVILRGEKSYDWCQFLEGREIEIFYKKKLYNKAKLIKAEYTELKEVDTDILLTDTGQKTREEAYQHFYQNKCRSNVKTSPDMKVMVCFFKNIEKFWRPKVKKKK